MFVNCCKYDIMYNLYVLDGDIIIRCNGATNETHTSVTTPVSSTTTTLSGAAGKLVSVSVSG